MKKLSSKAELYLGAVGYSLLEVWSVLFVALVAVLMFALAF